MRGAAALSGAALLVAAAAAATVATAPAQSEAERQQQQEGGRELPLEFVEGLKAIVGESNVTTDPDECVPLDWYFLKK